MEPATLAEPPALGAPAYEPGRDPPRPAPPSSRALLRIGGERLIRHQLGLALAAGCQTIICVARGFGPELADLQRDAEQGGARFSIVAGSTALAGMVTAADELLILAEGLLATTGDALRLLDSGQAVFVQPAEAGIPAGFERIDLNHASAGLVLMPGRLVERLQGLPPDTDPAAALLRIALQAGVPQRLLADEVRLAGRWLMIRSEAEAQVAEDGWMQRHTATGSATPGPLLARMLVRRFGPALLHGGTSTLPGMIGAALLGLAGLAITFAGFPTPGLLLAGAGWTVRRAAGLLEQLQSDALARAPRPVWHEQVFSMGFDAGLLALLVAALPVLPGESLPERAFPPAMLIGLVRLMPRIFGKGWGDWLADRLVLTMILAAFALGGVLNIGTPALAALLLFSALVLPRERDATGASQPAGLTRA